MQTEVLRTMEAMAEQKYLGEILYLYTPKFHQVGGIEMNKLPSSFSLAFFLFFFFFFFFSSVLTFLVFTSGELSKNRMIRSNNILVLIYHR